MIRTLRERKGCCILLILLTQFESKPPSLRDCVITFRAEIDGSMIKIVVTYVEANVAAGIPSTIPC